MLTTPFAKGLVTLAVTGAVISSAAYANEKKQEVSDTSSIERVHVWGTTVKSSSVFMGGDAIETKQADHISDLLRTIPGVDVGGAHSLNQRITIRSMDDKDLNITIDGANQNTYMYHHMGNLQIHADILQSVDIDVGSNSVVNGGLGGAVRFETKSAHDLLMGDERFGGRAQVNYGDNNASGFSVTGFGLLADTVDFIAYYNDVSRGDYHVGGNKILDASGQEIEGTNGEVIGLEGDTQDALIKFGWDITSEQRLKIGYEVYQDKGDYSYRPDMGLATDLAITKSLAVPLLWPTELSRETFTVNYDANWSEDSTIKMSLFSNTSELNRDETGWKQNKRYEGWAGDITGIAENIGVNIIGDTVINGAIEHELIYGIDVVKYDTQYEVIALFADNRSSKETATNSAIYVEDRIDFGNGFLLTPGIRYDNYDIESAVVEDSFSDFSAALAAQYSFEEFLTIKASSTQLFKGPEIGEVFIGAGLRDVANPDIKAETGFNHELALAYGDNIFGADAFTAGVTFFQTNIDNYIYDSAQITGGGRRDQWKDNVGDLTIDGVEFYTGYELGQLALQLSYSNAESELSAFEDYTKLEGARLERQQGNTFSASADYTIEAIDIALHWDMLAVDDVADGLSLDGASINNAKEGYVVHNISATWRPEQLDGLSVIFGVDNVFDEFYASHSSKTGTSFHPLFKELYLVDYEPGRNIKATIAYRF